MTIGDVSNGFTAIIFVPASVKREKRIFLSGDVEISDKTISVYVTELSEKMRDNCLGIYSLKDCGDGREGTRLPDTWIHLETHDNLVTLRKFKLINEVKNVKAFEFVVIYYDHEIFVKFKNSILTHGVINITSGDYFRSLTARLEPYKNESKSNFPSGRVLYWIQCMVLFMSIISKHVFFLTKYSNFGLYIDTYLDRLLWLTVSNGKDKRESIKKMNFTLSLLADAIFGVIFLNWLIEQCPADFSRNILPSAETIVQSLRDLIYWLTGDPAGFKLNFMFSKLLATFFLFYIDTWCAFIAYLSAYLRATNEMFVWIFHIIGRLGITFQLSIFADILGLVTFHIHCICLFAARLYNIQMSTLISLWRLFLGRKKNPLRNRVDSCKYTPEQLFIGTLAFTILLFLLPTTLIYYVVFTFIRILLSMLKGTLNRVRHFVHSLQIYSTILWLIGSPKVCAGIELIPEMNPKCKTNCLSFHVKPVCGSWSETILHDRPDCIEKPKDFEFLQFLYSLLIGTVY